MIHLNHWTLSTNIFDETSEPHGEQWQVLTVVACDCPSRLKRLIWSHPVVGSRTLWPWLLDVGSWPRLGPPKLIIIWLKLFLPELVATCSPSYNRLSSWGHRHIFYRSSERNEWIPCPGAGCDCGLPCFGALPVQPQHVEGVKDGGPSTCTGGRSSTLNTLRNHRSSRVWVF